MRPKEVKTYTKHIEIITKRRSSLIDIVQKTEKIFKRVCVRVIRKKKKKKGSHRCKVLPMYKRVTVPSLERKTVVSCFPIPGMGWLIKEISILKDILGIRI